MNPDSKMKYYSNPEEMYDQADAREIFPVEEFFARLKYADFQALMASPAESEEQTAVQAEQILAGNMADNPDALAPIMSVLSGIRMMETEGRSSVPEALRTVVQRTLEVPEQREAPALLVRILKDTMEVVKSSFQNVSLQNAEGLPVRSSALATSPRERTDRFELRQVVSVDLTIFYEILRENGSEIMLRVHLEPEPAHCRVNLLQNDRIVTSLTYVRGTGGITFQRLSPGNYRIEIKGDDWDFATSIAVEGE